MTATCTLCGTLISAEPDPVLDPQRDDRTFGRLGGIFRKHLAQFHGAEPQKVLDQGMMKGSVPQMIGVIGVTAQAAAMFSFLESTDEVFQQKTVAMKQIIEKAIEQKRISPLVTAS